MSNIETIKHYRKTGEAPEWFMEKTKDPEFKKGLELIYKRIDDDK